MRPFARLLLVFSLVAASPAAQAQPRVEVLSYGTYQGRTVRTVPMPKSISGQMNLIDELKHVKKTREIFGRLGEQFGFEYRIHGIAAGEKILILTTHPPLTNPKTGDTMTTGEREQDVAPGARRYTGYGFDETYEIGEGEWSFQIVYRGRVIHEEKFKIVVPVN
jgi:hypothetical protein